jgi:excisionase family DNA binding protein
MLPTQEDGQMPQCEVIPAIAPRAPSPMVTVTEAAWLLNVDEVTIRRLIAAGLPAACVVNGRRRTWRVPRVLIRDFLAEVYAGRQPVLADFAARWRGPEAVA